MRISLPFAALIALTLGATACGGPSEGAKHPTEAAAGSGATTTAAAVADNAIMVLSLIHI